MKDVILYARVSTDKQHNENQEYVLLDWAKRNDIIDFKLWLEHESSRKTRPIKEEIMKGFRNGTIQTVVVVNIDRWARSLQELISDCNYICSNGGRFVSINNGFDFTRSSYDATQNLILSIFGALAEFERSLISARTIAGLERAKRNGKKLGRPKGSKNKVPCKT